MFMKPRRSDACSDNDPAIKISFASGKVISLRRSELGACAAVARVLRVAAGGRKAFLIIDAPEKPKPPRQATQIPAR